MKLFILLLVLIAIASANAITIKRIMLNRISDLEPDDYCAYKKLSPKMCDLARAMSAKYLVCDEEAQGWRDTHSESMDALVATFSPDCAIEGYEGEDLGLKTFFFYTQGHDSEGRLTDVYEIPRFYWDEHQKDKFYV